MLPWFLRRWLGFPAPEPDSSPVDPEPFVRPPNTAFDQSLADAILCAPNDPAPYHRYGQWLCEQNDPRGPLILSMIEGGAATFEPTHSAQFLGPLADVPGTALTWRWGFWDTVRIDDSWGDRAAPLLREVLVHPSALVLRDLFVSTGRMEAVAEVLADGPISPIRRLHVNAEGTSLGAWAAVWYRMQGLEELVLEGANVQIGDLSLPALEVLDIRGPLDDSTVRDLERAHLPSLEQLRSTRPDALRGAFGDRAVAL